MSFISNNNTATKRFDFVIKTDSTITGNNLEKIYTDTIIPVYDELSSSQEGGN